MTSDDSSLSCFLEDDATETKVSFASTCFDRCIIETNKNSQTASAYVRKVAREQIVGRQLLARWSNLKLIRS